MRRIIIVYGLIAGAIVSVLMWFSMFLWSKGAINFDNGEYFGYGSMLVALSMIFFGIKSYRDYQNDGSIKFWKGIQIGLLISLLASLMYAASWEVYYQTNADFHENFFDRYTEHYVKKLRENASHQEKIDRVTNEMTSMREMYKYFPFRFGITIIEILPVGIIVTLLSAAILRKKEILAE